MDIVPLELESYIVDYLDTVSKTITKLTCHKYNLSISSTKRNIIQKDVLSSKISISISNMISVRSKAAFYGYLDIILYYTNLNYEWDKNTEIQALKGGHLNLIEYLYSNSLIIFDHVTYNHLHILKYLKSLNISTNIMMI